MFDRNISDTTGHQMIVHFSSSSDVCFCTIWENRKYEVHVLHFYPNALLLLNENNTQC